jgi:hypothetical protein
MKYLFALAIIMASFGCNSNSTNSNSTKDSTTQGQPIQNVNGNIPDTTRNGGVDITGKQKIDTTKIDSSRMKK